MTQLKFWGVRGSIPTPGPTTIRYGGNTSCLEIRFNEHLFILDAGSGIRALGNELAKQNQPIRGHIFISHMHWDHIQGIPFFAPAFLPGNHFTFYGANEVDANLKKIISGQMDPSYFPIEMGDMGAHLSFVPLNEGLIEVEGVPVESIFVNHPGNALGYKFRFNEAKIVYISDNEPFATVNEKDDTEFIGEDGNEKLVRFLMGADILIHDAQYTPEEYAGHVTWGHSPYDYAVQLAREAQVKKLILFHHDPLHNDDKIDEILDSARELAARDGSPLEVMAAKEGVTLDF